MNAVDFAVDRIVNAGDLDDYILKLAFDNPNGGFGSNWYNYGNQYSVEQGIREKVIHGIVLPECNVNGGITELIDLTGSRIDDLGQGFIGVNVPDMLTGGRKIISVVEVYQGALNSSSGVTNLLAGMTTDGESALTDSLAGMITALSSNRSVPQTYTRFTMTGNNSFVIHNAPSGLFSLTAKVVLAFDEGLSSISPKSYLTFANLCRLATKSYIYKTCRRPTDEAVMRSGVPIDAIKDDIGDMKDAWEDYREYFDTTWTKTMAYNDPIRKADIIKAVVPRRI